MAATEGDLTVTLDADLAKKLEAWAKREGGSCGELVEEAVRAYIDEREWRDLLEYGRQRANELDIKREDVPRLIEEVRGELDANPELRTELRARFPSLFA